MTDNPDGPITDGEVFAEFVDWRIEQPADDLTTEFLEAEFTDETGITRKLRRDELLMFMNVVAVAGAETTTRLIGWAANCCPNIPISAAVGGGSVADPRRDRRDLRYRAARAAGRSLRHPRCRVPRATVPRAARSSR